MSPWPNWLRSVHTLRFFSIAFAFFSCPKMDSMCVNESVHTLRLRWLSACDAKGERVRHPFCATATAFFLVVVTGSNKLALFQLLVAMCFAYFKCRLLLSKVTENCLKCLYDVIDALQNAVCLQNEGRDVFSLFLCSGKCSKYAE